MTLKYPLLLFSILPIILILFLGLKTGAYQRVLLFPTAQRGFRLPMRLALPSWIPFVLRIFAFLLLVLALARPQSSSSQVRRLAEGIDIMIALDVSQSMTIEDVDIEGANRLDVAKEVVKKFISGRQDDRIGFAMFSGEGVTLCPPTLDYQILLDSVEESRTGVMRDGTAIGEAIANGVNRLKESKAKSRVVILITDGDNNMGSIAPLTAGEIAAGYGIKVYSIALGKEGIVRYPEYQDFLGIRRKVYRQTNSSINPELLMKISEETGGKFFRADDTESLSKVFREIDKLEKNKIETKERILWEEHFQKFLFAALLFLFLDLLLRSTIFRILPE